MSIYFELTQQPCALQLGELATILWSSSTDASIPLDSGTFPPIFKICLNSVNCTKFGQSTGKLLKLLPPVPDAIF